MTSAEAAGDGTPPLDWRDGNHIRLLENGDQFFPRVFEAIRAAHREVLIETFILFEDKVGKALQHELIAAAGRGVRIELCVDGFGSADLSADFVAALNGAGIRIRMFDPRPKFLGMRTNLFRRLHRKILVVDGLRAFVGGINFSAEHLSDFGPQAKQDYAVEVVGPVARDIRRVALADLSPRRPPRRPLSDGARPDNAYGRARALFVVRDNRHHPRDIEDRYLEAIQGARRRLLIANAYFFPGYRLLRGLRDAARRGVRVELILQGQPDMAIAQFGARILYNYLVKDGVIIHEYDHRPLHCKVALADDGWATVGSSNLDPLSLALNLEANLVIRDSRFNHDLSRSLERLKRLHCRAMTPEKVARGLWWRLPLAFLSFHILRHFPAWIGWLPAHRPKLELLGHEPAAGDLQRPGR